MSEGFPFCLLGHCLFSKTIRKKKIDVLSLWPICLLLVIINAWCVASFVSSYKWIASSILHDDSFQHSAWFVNEIKHPFWMSTVSEFSLCFSLYFLFQLRILHLCFKFVLIAHLTVRKKRKMHNLCRSKNKEHIRCGFRKKYK